MVNDRPEGTDQGYSRRQVLRSAGGLAAGAALGMAQQDGSRVKRVMIVPAVQEFRGNYVGQFVAVNGANQNRDVGSPPLDECSARWSSDETQVYDGQLVDRRSERPIAVQVPLFVNGQLSDLAEGAMFIINSATPCGDYVRLETEWIKTRALVGEPPGPTVQETAANGGGGPMPGFGALVGVAGIAGGLLARKLYGQRED